MAELQDLNGAPLTWAELYRRNELWHAQREPVPHPPRRCGSCFSGRHRACSGSMSAVGGHGGDRSRLVPCTCACRETVELERVS